MGRFFDWFRVFRHVAPPMEATGDPADYHRRRFLQEQEFARDATSPAARDAHRRLAAEHRIALARLEGE
ncbi:hypothetical protein [Sphingomonas sp. VNH70]|uniref:hypothetical protein n=1 Tax=Sphingomonas silueang TaxID=3156617 RepID=UPI0032B52EB4